MYIADVIKKGREQCMAVYISVSPSIKNYH